MLTLAQVWREKFSTLCDLRARESVFKAQHTHRKLATDALHQWLQKTVDRRDLAYSAEVIGQQKIARWVLLNDEVYRLTTPKDRIAMLA